MHIGNFRDVPLIEVSVEGGSITKHCRKTRRPITFTVNAQEKKGARKNPDQKYSNSPKKANILQTTYITPSTQTPE
jgi:hypothetical protein